MSFILLMFFFMSQNEATAEGECVSSAPHAGPPPRPCFLTAEGLEKQAEITRSMAEINRSRSRENVL